MSVDHQPIRVPAPSGSLLLVTGATGFTGNALAQQLLRVGHRVRVMVRDRGRARSLAEAGMEVFEGDLCDADAIDRAVAGCRVVYHLAAVYRTAGHPDSYYHQVNTVAVGTILAAARRHGVERTVHCSTAGVHGHVTTIPSDETAPFNPGDVYQRSKIAGEDLARRAIAEGQPVTIFRPVGIYGPGDQRFLKLFNTIHDGSFRMFGKGEVAYHLTYIDDLVQGIILCGEHPAAMGETFLLCGDRYVTLNELARLVAAAVNVPPPRGRLPLWPLMAAAHVCEWICQPLGIDPPLHPRRCEFFTKARAFTNRKARNLLGFAPKVSLEEGLARTAEWYFENGLLRHRGKIPAHANPAPASRPLTAPAGVSVPEEPRWLPSTLATQEHAGVSRDTSLSPSLGKPGLIDWAMLLRLVQLPFRFAYARRTWGMFGLSVALAGVLAMVLLIGGNELHTKIVHSFNTLDVAFVGGTQTYGAGVWDWRLGDPAGFRTANYAQPYARMDLIDLIVRERVLPENPKVVCIMAGAMDASLGDVKSTVETYLRILDLLRQRGVRVVITSTLPRGDGSITPFVKALNQRLKAYAAVHPEEIEYVDLWPELTNGETLEAAMTSDGVRLNRRAYDIWAEEIDEAIIEVTAGLPDREQFD